MPNGRYVVSVVASDAPSNSPATALTGAMESTTFDIDNTPPAITVTAVRRDGTRVRSSPSTCATSDSAVQKAEYSLDGDRWQTIYPRDGIADSRLEQFELSAGRRAAARGVIIRATDALNNVTSARGDGAGRADAVRPSLSRPDRPAIERPGRHAGGTLAAPDRRRPARRIAPAAPASPVVSRNQPHHVHGDRRPSARLRRREPRLPHRVQHGSARVPPMRPGAIRGSRPAAARSSPTLPSRVTTAASANTASSSLASRVERRALVEHARASSMPRIELQRVAVRSLGSARRLRSSPPASRAAAARGRAA